MKVSSERIANSQVVLNIEVEPELVEKGFQKAYRRIVNRVNIPGFRKGKAPLYVVERMVGREALFEEAAKELLPQAYRDAVQQENVNPIAEPELEIVDFEPLVFKATVPIPPTVELGDYKAVRLQPEQVAVTEEQVEAAIKAKQEENATWEEPDPERGAQPGDRVTVDVEMFHDGGLVGEKAEAQTVVLGTTPLLPGLDERLAGAKPDDAIESELVLPADYPVKEVAGQEVTIKMMVVGVKEKRLPALDDEFAKSVGDCQTMVEVREKTRADLLQEAQARADERFSDLVIRTVTDQSKVDMPPVMADREVEHLVQDYEESLRAQRLTLDQFLKYSGKKIEDFREQLRPRAEQRVRTGLVLGAIREAEGITVSDEELSSETDKVVEGLGESADRVREALNSSEARESFRTNLLEEKIIKHLKDIVTQPEPEEVAAAEGTAVPEPAAEVEAASVAVEAPATTEPAIGESDKEASTTNE